MENGMFVRDKRSFAHRPTQPGPGEHLREHFPPKEGKTEPPGLCKPERLQRVSW